VRLTFGDLHRPSGASVEDSLLPSLLVGKVVVG